MGESFQARVKRILKQSGEDLPEELQDTENVDRKQVDLERAQNRTVSRPIKKGSDKAEGRYIPPEEIKKEIAKLEQEKKAAKEKKKGFFSRFFHEKKAAESVAEDVLVTEEKKPELGPEERKEQIALAEQVKKLRGMNIDASDYVSVENEGGWVQKELSFEPKYKIQPVLPKLEDILPEPVSADETLATALSVAVGAIYWDEQNLLVDRIITVRRIFRRKGGLLIDAFCHDIMLPRLIALSRVVRLYNMRSLRPYEDPTDFLLHHIAGLKPDKKPKDNIFAAVMSVVRYDLAILAFAARSDFEKNDIENQLILKYVYERCPTIDFDEAEVLDYIAMLVPDEQSFYEAIEIMVQEPYDVILLFMQTFVKMILSDGVIHENERELLAELVYVLRLQGIELNMLGLK